MERMYKLCEIIEKELHKIAEKGLTTSNLDSAYKLVDMYKDLKNTDYWEQKGEYYEYVLQEMKGGYSHNDGMEDDYSMRGRRRDSMGRYSRDDGMMHDERHMRRNRHYPMSDGGYSMYDRYMDNKMSYRTNQSMDGKKKLIDSLEEYMDDFTEKIKEMHRDADTPEEREMISKFMTKLQNIR